MNDWIAIGDGYVQPIDGRTVWCIYMHTFGWMLTVRYSDLPYKNCGVYNTPEQAAAATETVELAS